MKIRFTTAEKQQLHVLNMSPKFNHFATSPLVSCLMYDNETGRAVEGSEFKADDERTALHGSLAYVNQINPADRLKTAAALAVELAEARRRLREHEAADIDRSGSAMGKRLNVSPLNV